MPNYTLTAPGPIYSAAPTRLRQHRHRHSLWGVSLYPDHPGTAIISSAIAAGAGDDGAPMSNRMLALSNALLLVSLLAVVLLAQRNSRSWSMSSTAKIGAPPALRGLCWWRY